MIERQVRILRLAAVAAEYRRPYRGETPARQTAQ
jgi:hypothetical protein